jgi:Predicted transcriptional regulators
MENNSLGNNIVRIRKEKKMSQKNLANIINMTPQSLLKIEKGMVNPKTETLEKIIKALNITPNELYVNSDVFSVSIQLPVARNVDEIELLEKLKDRNSFINYITTILENSSDEEYDKYNPETDCTETHVFTVEDRAKHILWEEFFNTLSVDELLGLYKYHTDNKLLPFTSKII